MFTGDLLFNGGTPFALMGSVSGWIEVLETVLRPLRAATLVPGHGPVCGPEVIDDDLAYLRFVQATAQQSKAGDCRRWRRPGPWTSANSVTCSTPNGSSVTCTAHTPNSMAAERGGPGGPGPRPRRDGRLQRRPAADLPRLRHRIADGLGKRGDRGPAGEYAELTQITGGDVFRTRNYTRRPVRSAAGPTTSPPSTSRACAPSRASGPPSRPRSPSTATPADRRARRTPRPDTARRPRADPGAGPGTQAGPAAQPGARRHLGRRARGGIGAGQLDGLAGFGARRARSGSPAASRSTGRAASGSCSTWPCTRRPPWSRPCPGSRLPALRLRGVAAADAGDHRRRRHPGGRAGLGAADGGVHRPARGGLVIGSGPDQDLDPDRPRAPGRPARGAARRLGRGAAVLHRLQRAQRRGPPDRDPAGAQAVRVRAVRSQTRAS